MNPDEVRNKITVTVPIVYSIIFIRFLFSQIPIEIGIVHQYPFNSNTQSMCVIGQVFGSRRYTVYCKGAPEKIIQNCKAETSNIKINYINYTSFILWFFFFQSHQIFFPFWKNLVH